MYFALRILVRYMYSSTLVGCTDVLECLSSENSKKREREREKEENVEVSKR